MRLLMTAVVNLTSTVIMSSMPRQLRKVLLMAPALTMATVSRPALRPRLTLSLVTLSLQPIQRASFLFERHFEVIFKYFSRLTMNGSDRGLVRSVAFNLLY